MKTDALETLIKHTCEYVLKNNIDPNDMNTMKVISRNKNSVFSNIYKNFFGEINYSQVLRIRQMWIRNQQSMKMFTI